MKEFLRKLLPPYICVQLENSPNAPRVIANTIWLFADKILRLGVGLFIGVWIARYLGPQQFGTWSYALAFVSLFGVFSTLGLEKIVIRNIVRQPSETNAILGSAFVLMFLGGVATLITSLTVISFLRHGEQLVFLLVGLSAAGNIFQAFNVIDYYFQSHVSSRYSVVAQNAAFLTLVAVKVALILYRAPLIAFAVAGLIEVAMGSIFMAVTYHRKHLLLTRWNFNAGIAKKLLKDSWPLILSGLAIMIYMRIDQIMIGEMLGDVKVGIYSAAVRISEAWYFVPVAIVSSAFPVILQIRQRDEKLYYLKIQTLYDILTFLGIVVALITIFISGPLMRILYGPEYAGSASVLSLHIWTGVSVSLGVTSNSWLMAENLQMYAFYRTFTGAVINLLLNFMLIPRYGINGAAVATIIASFTAAYFFDATNAITRKVFLMKSRSLLLVNLLSRSKKDNTYLSNKPYWSKEGHLNENEAKFLTEMLKIINPTYALEVGFASGRSASIILLNAKLKKFISIDANLDYSHWDGRKIARRLKSDFRHFKIIEGKSQKVFTEAFFAREFPFGIDFVFIDGGHSYQECMADIMNVYGHISRNGCMIIDDYMSGPPDGCSIPEVNQAVNDFAAEHKLKKLIWHKNGKGCAVFLKNDDLSAQCRCIEGIK